MRRHLALVALPALLAASCGHAHTATPLEVTPAAAAAELPPPPPTSTPTTAPSTTSTTVAPAPSTTPSTTSTSAPASTTTTVYTGDRCQTSDSAVADCGTDSTAARGWRLPDGSCTIADDNTGRSRELTADPTCPIP